MKKVTIYTDGACSGNPGPGGWAAIIMNECQKQEISGGVPETTNNIMELTAVIEALKSLTEPLDVELYSDSAYIVNAFNQNWLNKWKRNGWRASNRQAVKNKELWLELDKLVHIHKVKFKKVKGHNGDALNERCDKLATSEYQKYLIGEDFKMKRNKDAENLKGLEELEDVNYMEYYNREEELIEVYVTLVKKEMQIKQKIVLPTFNFEDLKKLQDILDSKENSINIESITSNCDIQLDDNDNLLELNNKVIQLNVQSNLSEVKALKESLDFDINDILDCTKLGVREKTFAFYPNATLEDLLKTEKYQTIEELKDAGYQKLSNGVIWIDMYGDIC